MRVKSTNGLYELEMINENYNVVLRVVSLKNKSAAPIFRQSVILESLNANLAQSINKSDFQIGGQLNSVLSFCVSPVNLGISLNVNSINACFFMFEDKGSITLNDFYEMLEQ